MNRKKGEINVIVLVVVVIILAAIGFYALKSAKDGSDTNVQDQVSENGDVMEEKETIVEKNKDAMIEKDADEMMQEGDAMMEEGEVMMGK